MSPMMTVVVLTVLWLIVVVPMVLRRNDERAREKSVERFGRAMRALTRGQLAAGRAARTADPDEASYVLPRTASAPAEVFVTGAARAHDSDAVPARDLPSRRPVPVAEEALMYPVDRSEMSAARRAMMARRRRSLTILTMGSAVTFLAALVLGGATWLLAVPFLLGLVGYLGFLRNQALHDRERRAARQLRSVTRRPRDYDATEVIARPAPSYVPDSVVRIDDDDIELHNLDTVDLTGLYSEHFDEPAQRRAG